VQDPVNAEEPLKVQAVGTESAENTMTPPLKIAVVSVQTPAFDAGSSDLRLHHILRILLNRGHRIDYLFPVAGKSDEKYKSVYNNRIDFRKIEKTVESFAEYLMSKANDEPDAVWITNLWNIDYAVFALQIVRWLKQNRPHIRIIVDTMDFHYKKHMRRFELYHDPQDRDKAEHFLTLEKQLYHLADRVLTVTDVEKHDILADAPDARVEVFPNILDILRDGPDLRLRRHICFVGSFNVWHNRDAVIWFLKDIFPMIRTQNPDVQFHIIGHGNEKYRDALETYPNVRVIGYVQDAERAVAQYRLSVCPMTYGAGMKGKIGLAAAAGTPFVTTSIGAEGFDWVDGKGLLYRRYAERICRTMSPFAAG
jgi:glycosyltransferase involved in cell wall biosynthesis